MKRVVLAGLATVWAVALGYGIHVAMSYDLAPGQRAAGAPTANPQEKWQCIVVAHPLCPCTPASLIALREVAARHPELAVSVVFVGDKPQKPSRSMNIAASWPGANVTWIGEEEASATYKAFTSGQVFVYEPQGELVYSGGVTPGRGVDQPQHAVDLFERILEHRQPVDEGDVFGCALRSNDD